jgi:hypothetical protein
VLFNILGKIPQRGYVIYLQSQYYAHLEGNKNGCFVRKTKFGLKRNFFAWLNFSLQFITKAFSPLG